MYELNAGLEFSKRGPVQLWSDTYSGSVWPNDSFFEVLFGNLLVVANEGGNFMSNDGIILNVSDSTLSTLMISDPSRGTHLDVACAISIDKDNLLTGLSLRAILFRNDQIVEDQEVVFSNSEDYVGKTTRIVSSTIRIKSTYSDGGKTNVYNITFPFICCHGTGVSDSDNVMYNRIRISANFNDGGMAIVQLGGMYQTDDYTDQFEKSGYLDLSDYRGIDQMLSEVNPMEGYYTKDQADAIFVKT